MTAPEQLQPPVYGFAAGAVLHAHGNDALEPAVLLYTFLPPGAEDRLRSHEARVDVHGDGPGSSTVTVRVLSEQQSLSWQLPIAPLVAALPGQPGNDGRMVLLGVVDAEPEPGFWMAPVDCERLAAELQLPVVDLVDSLRGRLTPWLADDVDVLLHDDAHEHAADQSPEQTLASAVLRHYRGELDAEQATTRLLRGLEFGAPEFQAALGRQLAMALWTAFTLAPTATREQVLAQTSPLETEVLRLLTEVPAALQRAVEGHEAVDGPVRVAEVLLSAAEREEAVRAAVSVVARLVRAAVGSGLTDGEVLERLAMVDDDGLARLAGLWVAMAVAVDAPASAPGQELTARVVEGGPAAARWLEDTAAGLLALAHELPGRRSSRLQAAVDDVQRRLAATAPPGHRLDAASVGHLLQPCLELARTVRSRAGLGPGAWLRLRPQAAASAVGAALVGGLSAELAVDLLAELLEPDVEGPHLLDAFVCATAQLLRQLEPEDGTERTSEQVQRALARLPAGARSARWLLVACLREAAGHDPSAPDLSALVRAEPAPDLDRIADRAGVRGVLQAGQSSLAALAEEVGPDAGMGVIEVLALLLPAALAEHDLLRVAAPADVTEAATRLAP